jgi:hypothetical protein
MKARTLAIWLVAIGVALWMSSRVVDTQPGYARATMIVAAVVFGGFAVRPPRP